MAMNISKKKSSKGKKPMFGGSKKPNFSLFKKKAPAAPPMQPMQSQQPDDEDEEEEME